MCIFTIATKWYVVKAIVVRKASAIKRLVTQCGKVNMFTEDSKCERMDMEKHLRCT